MVSYIFILSFIIIVLLLIFIVPIYYYKKDLIIKKETFGEQTTKPTNKPSEKPRYKTKSKVFKAPVSLTKLNTSQTILRESTTKPIASKDLETLLASIEKSRREIEGNILDFPSFFHSNEKWPGCLPRPLYQGTCGSCWGFASVSTLSSRFYIETCGLSGCKNYPQINFGSINNVNYNINELYKFKKLFLTDAFEQIDTNKNGNLSYEEWLSVILDYHKIFSSQSTPYIDRHYIAQILVYILNFQSLGSIDLTNKSLVEERARDAFDIWVKILEKNKIQEKLNKVIENDTDTTNSNNTNNTKPTEKLLNITELKDFWLNEPITLSAEKIISCCNTCMKLDYVDTKQDNPVCLGSTLDEAWSMLRESGTTTADCIGYNLDSWTEGSYSPSCKEVQGPLYSFCSGYVIDKSNFQLGDRSGSKSVEWAKDINELLDKYENSNINPVAIPSTEKNIPWVDPQLFRFRAKNVYKVKNNVHSIQREILERGPVTTGIDVYPDFQYSFGLAGGSEYKDTTKNPLGSEKDSLIYMWNGEGEPVGGHAIVIVGWGTYTYTHTDSNNKTTTYDIPYWICLNSWGYLWGTSGLSDYENRKGLPNDMSSGGYFWIIRGLNMCGIEDNVIVGQPDIYNISYPDVPTRYGWGLPNPSTEDVMFIKQKTEVIDLGADNFLKYEKPLDGGGSFTDKIVKDNKTTWTIESMNPPSPFVLFWNSPRPIYCLGKTLNKLSELNTDNIIDVSKDTLEILKKITNIQKNPLLIINDEQLQFLEYIGSRIKVLRGVNNSFLSKHDPNSEIQIFPYKNLSTIDLNKIAKQCSEISTVE